MLILVMVHGSHTPYLEDFFLSCTNSKFRLPDYEFDVSQHATWHISPSLAVEDSPGVKPGSVVLCQRVQIIGLSRLKNLEKYAHSVKVEVSNISSSYRMPIVEVCFHRNISLRVGMCSQDQLERLVKGSWSKSTSPFDNKLLDIRVSGSSAPVMQVSITEEFILFRVLFLALGITLMALASTLSNSLVFYYSCAMGVGIILVILVVLFQGMKLLPTGQKTPLAIILYGSLVGLGSLLVGYVPRLFRSVLTELGISEDLYNPLALFIVVFLALTGAWLGFWIVRKLVLTEDGTIENSVATFIAWSIWIIGATMISQSSEDPLLAGEVLLAVILVSSLVRRLTKARFVRHFFKRIRKTRKKSMHQYQSPASPSSEYSYDKYVEDIGTPETHRPITMNSHLTPSQATVRTPNQLSDSGTFYSSFHRTPQRRNFSSEEWEVFTEINTKKALEGLVSSADFSKWAVANADRLSLTPPIKKARPRRRSRWLPSF